MGIAALGSQKANPKGHKGWCAIQIVNGSSGVSKARSDTGVCRGYGRWQGERSRAHTANKMGHGCNDVQPAAIPRGDWDTLRRVLKTKRISKQAEKVGAETSGGRTGGCQTGGAGPYIGKRDIKAVVIRRRVRSQQQHIRTKVGNRTTCSQGRSVRRGHFGGSHIRLALGQVESVSGLVAAWL
jgi:hypothetical protein